MSGRRSGRTVPREERVRRRRTHARVLRVLPAYATEGGDGSRRTNGRRGRRRSRGTDVRSRRLRLPRSGLHGLARRRLRMALRAPQADVNALVRELEGVDA